MSTDIRSDQRERALSAASCSILRDAVEKWGEPINPKVVDAVLALNEAGVKTFCSGDLYSDDLVYIDLTEIVPEGVILPAGWIRTSTTAAITLSDLTGDPPRWGNGTLMCEQAIELRTTPEDYRRVARLGVHPVSPDHVDALVFSLSNAEVRHGEPDASN